MAMTATQIYLGEEEQKILPLVRKYLTVNQWKALGERGAEAIDDKTKRLIFLGMILEDTSPDEERNFLSRMPAPVRLLWKVVVLARDEFFKAADGFFQGNKLAFEPCKLFGNVERLREKPLNFPCPCDGELIFFRQLINSQNGDNVL